MTDVSIRHMDAKAILDLQRIIFQYGGPESARCAICARESGCPHKNAVLCPWFTAPRQQPCTGAPQHGPRQTREKI